MSLRIAPPGGTLSPDDVARNFNDIAPAMTRPEAIAESARCLYCYDAPCAIACPTHIDIPSFIKKIHNDNVRGAARVILDANPMGHSCARACPVDSLCEGSCVMNEQQMAPIQIGRLQRFATDAALSNDWKLFSPGAPTGKKVAIVGAGPAGLSCAQDLRRAGHDVTIFDARAQPGGLNTYGIAQYKLTPDTAIAEAKSILALGVTLKSGVTVGRDIAFDDVIAQHDAVFLGMGLGGTKKMGIPGEELSGVMDALTFIEHLKGKAYGDYKVPDRVLVVGAGNTAVDAATQARRLGARDVAFVYRRGPDDVSAYDYEIELAQNDGCTFHYWTTPLAVVGTGKVEGLRVKTAEGERMLPADLVIVAIGQAPHANVLRGFGIATDDKGRAVVDATLRTSHAKVFAGGDCINGGKEIVNAAADGKKAAASIHALLSGARTSTGA